MGWIHSCPASDPFHMYRPILAGARFLNHFLSALDWAGAIREPAMPRRQWSSALGPALGAGFDNERVALLLGTAPEGTTVLWYAENWTTPDFVPLVVRDDKFCHRGHPMILRRPVVDIPVEVGRGA